MLGTLHPPPAPFDYPHFLLSFRISANIYIWRLRKQNIRAPEENACTAGYVNQYHVLSFIYCHGMRLHCFSTVNSSVNVDLEKIPIIDSGFCRKIFSVDSFSSFSRKKSFGMLIVIGNGFRNCYLQLNLIFKTFPLSTCRHFVLPMLGNGGLNCPLFEGGMTAPS